MRILIGKIIIVFTDIILAINLAMWLSILIVGDTSTQLWDFDNYYFGLKSITNWFQDMPDTVTNYSLLRSIINCLRAWTQNRLLTYQNTITNLIGNILFPFEPTVILIEELISLGTCIYNVIMHAVDLLKGLYNIPISNYPSVSYPDIPSWDFITKIYLG